MIGYANKTMSFKVIDKKLLKMYTKIGKKNQRFNEKRF